MKNKKEITNNLLSTLTKKKMSTLLFIIWLSANETETDAGQAFRNCLAYHDKDVVYYDLIAKLPLDNNVAINSGGISEICCESGAKCLPISWWTCGFGRPFFCNKIAQSINCQEWIVTGPCGGVIGDNAVTDNTTLWNCEAGYGASLAPIANYLASLPSGSLSGIDKGYAVHICPKSSPCGRLEECNWDNGGWTCSAFTGENNNCLLQWPASWPGPINKNPFPTPATPKTITTTATIYSPSTTFTPKDNSNLTIGLASTTGILGLYFLGTMGIGGMWLWKKFRPTQG